MNILSAHAQVFPFPHFFISSFLISSFLVLLLGQPHPTYCFFCTEVWLRPTSNARTCEVMKTEESFSFANCSGVTYQQFAVAQARQTTAFACCVIFLFVIILFVILAIYKRKKRLEPLKLCENVVKRLTIWLTATTLPYELFLAIHSKPHSCNAIGFLIQYFGSVQFLLTLGIGVALLIRLSEAIKPEWHLKITKEFTCCCCKRKISILEVVSLVLGFVLPLINLIIFATKSCGDIDVGPCCLIASFKKNCTTDFAGRIEQPVLDDVLFTFILFVTLALFCTSMCLLCYVIRKGKDTLNIVSDSLLFIFFMAVLCVIEIPAYFALPFINQTQGVWLFYAVSIPIKGILIPTALTMAICLPIYSTIAKCKNRNQVEEQGRTLSAITEHHSSDWSVLNSSIETVFEPSHEDSEYARLVSDQEKQDYSGIM